MYPGFYPGINMRVWLCELEGGGRSFARPKPEGAKGVVGSEPPFHQLRGLGERCKLPAGCLAESSGFSYLLKTVSENVSQWKQQNTNLSAWRSVNSSWM